MFFQHLSRPGKRSEIGSIGAVCLFVALTVRPAWATNCSYSIGISEDLNALESGLPSSLHTTAAEWVYLRNNPYLQITNTSDPTSGATLTSLTIQLNNPTQDLSITQIDIDPVGSVSTIDPTLASLPTVGTSAITLDFSNFDPGDSVIFRVHLVPASSQYTKFADYRQIFFTFGSSTSENAASMVTFHTSDTQDPNPVAGPNVWNNLPANMASQTSFGIAYSCLNAPDTVINIPAITGNNPQVPEPSTLLLGSLGLVGLFLGRSRLKVKAG